METKSVLSTSSMAVANEETKQKRGRKKQRKQTNKTMRSAQINKWKWKSSHAPETQSKTDSLLFLIRGKWNGVASEHHQFQTANNNGNFVCRNQTKERKKSITDKQTPRESERKKLRKNMYNDKLAS